MAVKKTANRVIDATVTMNTHEPTNLKPVAWAIVFASLVFAGVVILENEYRYNAGCSINYLDNNGMLLNSCDMLGE